MSSPFLAVSYFFHLIATVVWLGGLAILVLLVNPVTARTLRDNPALYRVLSEIRRRFLPLANFSLVMLVVTGLVQMAGDEHYDGLMQFDNDWSRVLLFKHIAIIGMVVTGLVLQYAVAPALERTSLQVERGKEAVRAEAQEKWVRLRRREVRLTWLNVGLGLLVLAFTAWATAL